MRFETWWDEIGCKKEYFSALEAAQAGWLAHKLYADTWPDHGVIEEELLALEDKPRPINVGDTWLDTTDNSLKEWDGKQWIDKKDSQEE